MNHEQGDIVMLEWVLAVFLYSTSLKAFEGTPLQRFDNLERCRAAATSMRLTDLTENQYICWPSYQEGTPV